MASQRRKPAFAPALTSAATPGEPSAFMSTMLQSPDSASHTAVCRPEPEAAAAQKSCSSGGSAGRSPGILR